MKKAIAVEARFDQDGGIRPLNFILEGKRHRVSSLGRQWKHDGEHHFLVMTPEQSVYELVYLQAEVRWMLTRSPQDFDPHRALA